MAQFTEERFTQAFEDIKTAFEDGFQFRDIAVLTERIVVFAEFFDLTGPEKKALALRMAKRILDETDIPVLPDKFVLPIVGDVGADALIMRFLPGMIDTIVKASKGALDLNKGKAGEIVLD